MTNLLAQLQLSNYDRQGTFILEADSGYQMVVGRAREMLKIDHALKIDLLGPDLMQLKTLPWEINPDLPWNDRISYVQTEIIPNALATRYDFKFQELSRVLNLKQKAYDVVYLNDPMLLRSFKALFFLEGKNRPKFIVHSHFVDDPSCPKFPTEASLWLGQCEAAIKADYNFWQCQSTLDIVEGEMRKVYRDDVVDDVLKKSSPWDDGYSITEVTAPINMKNLRFDPRDVLELFKKNVVLFVPNRIGGQGRSSDYTNCGKFMFELLPKLRAKRQDFVVIAGNPSQKFSNHELLEQCGPNGYVNLVPDSFNRDEFRWIAQHSDIAVGLYDQDSYGGTVARECIELGCVPLWIDNYEYASIAKEANWPYVADTKFGNEFIMMTDALIELIKNDHHKGWLPMLQSVVRKRCSYEATTKQAMEKMKLL